MGHVEENPNAYQRAILDVELLAKCDELVLTGGSTYGFVAAMKRKKMPYYVNGNSAAMVKCERMTLARPSVTPGGSAVFK